jgi:hypothetical protein
MMSEGEGGESRLSNNTGKVRKFTTKFTRPRLEEHGPVSPWMSGRRRRELAIYLQKAQAGSPKGAVSAKFVVKFQEINS